MQSRSLFEYLEPRRLFSGGYTYEQLASFSSAGGGPSSPGGQIVMDKSGNFYGFTTAGGANGTGAVYEVPAGSTTPITLVSFPAASSGTQLLPTGPVIDTNGNLFGVTETGGDSNQDGTVFEVVKGSNSITTLANFNSATTGTSPGGNVIIDAAGNLFGTTANGGANGCGTVWELPVGGSGIVTIASFSPVTVNGVPQNPGADGIAMDRNGNLYGTTLGNAAVGSDGTVWELASGTTAIQTLASFNGANGITPAGAIAVDGNGNVFGVAEFGGDNMNSTAAPQGSGTVWELPAGIGQIAALGNFDKASGGEFPIGGVVLDQNGNLFGTTSAGGDTTASFAGDGTVWEIPARTVSVKTIETFSGTNGSNPRGALIADVFGNIYGTTIGGGAAAGGSLFEMDLGGATESASALAPVVARTTLPASVAGGTSVHGLATVRVTNQAGIPVRGMYTIELFASTDGAIDSTATQIGSITRAIQVPRNESAQVNVPITSFPTAVEGSYTVLAQVVDLAGGTSLGTSGTNVTVAAPFIALTETLTRFTLPASTVSGAKVRAEATLKITNGGNISAIGQVTVALSAAPEGNSNNHVQVVPTPTASVSRLLAIAPGRSAIVVVPVTSIPAGLNGNFSIIADVADAKGGASNVVFPSTYTISPPVVALGIAVDSFKPDALAAGATARGTISITITNNGNIEVGTAADTGEFNLDMELVSQDLTQTASLASLARALPLNPGQSRKLTLPFSASLLASLTPGTYFPTVVASIAGTAYSTTATGQQPIIVS